jgi:hypothetical protein
MRRSAIVCDGKLIQTKHALAALGKVIESRATHGAEAENKSVEVI